MSSYSSYGTRSQNRGFTIDGFMDTLKCNYTPSVVAYIRSVYTLMGISLFFVGLGSYVAVKAMFMAGSLMGGLLSFLCVLGIVIMPATKENLKTRVGLLFATSFFMGHGMWPLIMDAIMVDPAIVITCLLGTSVVFIAFSLAALTARPGSYLYLGHSILYILTIMSITVLTQLLIGLPGRWVFTIYPYISLGVSCAFVLYDTQMIAAKAMLGSRDIVMDAALLVIDFVEIFRFLLKIMTNNKKSEKKRDE